MLISFGFYHINSEYLAGQVRVKARSYEWPVNAALKHPSKVNIVCCQTTALCALPVQSDTISVCSAMPMTAFGRSFSPPASLLFAFSPSRDKGRQRLESSFPLAFSTNLNVSLPIGEQCERVSATEVANIKSGKDMKMKSSIHE